MPAGAERDVDDLVRRVSLTVGQAIGGATVRRGGAGR